MSAKHERHDAGEDSNKGENQYRRTVTTTTHRKSKSTGQPRYRDGRIDHMWMWIYIHECIRTNRVIEQLDCCNWPKTPTSMVTKGFSTTKTRQLYVCVDDQSVDEELKFSKYYGAKTRIITRSWGSRIQARRHGTKARVSARSERSKRDTEQRLLAVSYIAKV